jgi:hypothetical protein
VDGRDKPGHDGNSIRNNHRWRELRRSSTHVRGGAIMGRYLLLWMLGIPLPILVLIYAFGGLH